MAKLCYNPLPAELRAGIKNLFNVNGNHVKSLLVNGLNTFFAKDKDIQGLDENALNNATITCSSCCLATQTTPELAVLHFISTLLMDEEIKHEYVGQLANKSAEDTIMSAMVSTIICATRS